MTDEKQYTSSARSLRYVEQSFSTEKYGQSSGVCNYFLLAVEKAISTAIKLLQRVSIESCREFRSQQKGILYCISLRLRQQSLHCFLCDPRRKRKIVYYHNTHREQWLDHCFSKNHTMFKQNNTNTYCEALQFCIDAFRAQHLGRSED